MKRVLLISAVVALAGCSQRQSETQLSSVEGAGVPPPLSSDVVSFDDVKVSISKLDQLPAPLPKPYDDAADLRKVNAAIDAAFTEAKAGGKRVIVDYGGNWCSWCRGLEGVMNLPEVRPFLDEHFVIVHVSTGLTSKEMNSRPETYKRFDVPTIDGTPYLVVAEADGTVLHKGSEVTDDQHQTPQAMVDWLAQWATPARKAAS